MWNIDFQISHELIQRRSQPFEWKDEFCKETLQVLAQHAVQVWLINLQKCFSIGGSRKTALLSYLLCEFLSFVSLSVMDHHIQGQELKTKTVFRKCKIFKHPLLWFWRAGCPGSRRPWPAGSSTSRCTSWCPSTTASSPPSWFEISQIGFYGSEKLDRFTIELCFSIFVKRPSFSVQSP